MSFALSRVFLHDHIIFRSYPAAVQKAEAQVGEGGSPRGLRLSLSWPPFARQLSPWSPLVHLPISRPPLAPSQADGLVLWPCSGHKLALQHQGLRTHCVALETV